MKTIILMRHGKAEDYWLSEDDRQRKLVNQGCNDARAIGAFLRKNNIVPQVVITSDATRAIETAQCVAEQLQFPIDAIIRKTFIYNGVTTDTLLGYIASLDDCANQLLIVGHNPDIAYLAGNMGDTPITHFPTAACVVFDFEVDKWSDIRVREGRLRLSVTPKSLKIND